MKYFKILLSLMLILCMSTVALGASLDNYYVDDVNVTLTASGTPEGAVYGEPITIEILSPGAAVADDDTLYDTEKLLNDYVYITQVPADVNGGYKVTVDMKDRESDFYTMRVNGKETEIKVFFATLNDKLDVLDEVLIICEGDVETAVDELVVLLDSKNPESTVVNMFNVSDPNTKEVDAAALAEILYNAIAEDDEILNSADLFKEALTKSVHIASLNEGIGNIIEYSTELGLDAEYLAIYNTQLKDTVKSDFTSDYFKGKKLYTQDAVAANFEESVIVAFTESFDANADVKLLIENFGKDIEVDMKDYNKLKTQNKTKLYEYIIDKAPYESSKELAKDINDKVDDLLDGQESSGGSGGGGGGGSFSGGTTGMTGTSGKAPIVAGGKDESSKFSDMSSYEWAKVSVEELAELGVVAGVGEGMFAPGRQITREEMLTMLLRAYGITPADASTDKFSDVAQGSWYAPYVAKGLELGVTSGISETEFGTGKYITRQEAAAMACRIAESMGKSFTSGTDSFADDSEIASWAKDAVYKLKNAKVINGTGNGTFAPLNTCTRAEAAVIIYALINI